MRRLFIVEMKAVVRMPDGVDALVQRHPFLAAAVRGRKAPGRIVCRWDRVLREGMQDVGRHQFLMLLFVIEFDLDQRGQLGQLLLTRSLEEFHHGIVDIAAIGGDFIGTWPGQMTALGAGMARAGADIIGIEEIGVIGMERLVAVLVLAEQKLLEEPGGMARCHFAGLASGMDWISWSSADRGAARRSVSSRTARNAPTRPRDRGPESEARDGEGVARVAAADAGFVTGVSECWRERCSAKLVPYGQSVLDRGSRSGKKPPGAMILVSSDYGSEARPPPEKGLDACQPTAILLWMHNGLGYIYR